MEPIRNLDGKLVCAVDRGGGRIEIIRQNCVTVIYMLPDGRLEIEQRRVRADEAA
jgi:hypothetical protein